MSIPYAAGPPLRRHSGTVRFPVGRRRKLSAAESANLHLVAAGTGIAIKLAAESPTLMVLAVEDLCWQLAVSDHAARRPAIWRRAERAVWNAEHGRWEATRQRLAAMALEAIAEL
jgi:hypothetical protein